MDYFQPNRIYSSFNDKDLCPYSIQKLPAHLAYEYKARIGYQM